MNRKTIIFIIFIVVVLAQLYVPAKMIWHQEDLLKNGVAYKFKTAPVDPTDIFRGKYISLTFTNSSIGITNEKKWSRNEKLYVSLTTDRDGFAKIKFITKQKPKTNEHYIQAEVRRVSEDGDKELTVRYPFNRYYMEESKAYEAELEYRKSQRDSSSITYALVSVMNGEAVLKDVLIDGVAIKEIVKNSRKETQE